MRTIVSAVVLTLLIHQAVANSPSYTVTIAANRFAQKLYSNLTQDSSENLLVCPLSLHAALSLVHQGAGGNSAAELATVLGLHADKETIREGYRHRLTKLVPSSGDALKVATQLFSAANFRINPEYVSVARKYFLSGMELVDYSDPDQAASQINKYVEEKTNNKIHDLITPDSISEWTKLIIVNAVHFQASWKTKFSTVHEGNFKVSADKVYRTNMMTQVNYFDYKEDTDLRAQIIRIKYNEGNYSMVFILPRDVEGLVPMERKLAINDFRGVLQNMENLEAKVTLPKFKLRQTHSMQEVLEKMGVKDLFGGAADLQGITRGAEPLQISEIIQKTFIDVNEHGTEAAAATDIHHVKLSANSGARSVLFRADHPFFFALVHNVDTVVFYGRLTHPVS